MLNKISFDEITKVIDAHILDLLSNAVQCEDEGLSINARVHVLSAAEVLKTAFLLGAISKSDFHEIFFTLHRYNDKLWRMCK